MKSMREPGGRWFLPLTLAVVAWTCIAWGPVASGQTPEGPARFSVREKPDRLVIQYGNQPIADYVFRDEKILRPYFSNVRLASGQRVTRTHPPDPKLDATDHAENHPGVWLAFGDISGHDFWRNKGRIEHREFTRKPVIGEGSLSFATQSQLLGVDGKAVCDLDSELELRAAGTDWMLIWKARFQSAQADFTFGDQEEMGFGVRMATPLIEKNGGTIVNAQGRTTAAMTWGQPAAWCDDSKDVDGHRLGVTLMASRTNFRESWWHNRDYGLLVANPFGRAAMKQGDTSAVTVKRGESFVLTFGACFHEGDSYRPSQAFDAFERASGTERP